MNPEEHEPDYSRFELKSGEDIWNIAKTLHEWQKTFAHDLKPSGLSITPDMEARDPSLLVDFDEPVMSAAEREYINDQRMTDLGHLSYDVDGTYRLEQMERGISYEP